MKAAFLILTIFLSFSARTEDWIPCGTDKNGNTANCEYKTENGTLTIRGVGPNGNLGSWNAGKPTPSPWKGKTYDNIVIESSIKDLGYQSFYTVKSNNPITVPSGITTISYGAFDGVITPEVIIPDTVTTIRQGAFNHSYISSVIIPESVTTIEQDAFTAYNGLPIHINLTISDQTTSIAPNAFQQSFIEHIYCTRDLARCKSNVGEAFEDKVVAASKKQINGVTYITDKSGNIIMKSGDRQNKRIYTVEEAVIVSKPTGNTLKLRYK